jgi:hypothetical protein
MPTYGIERTELKRVDDLDDEVKVALNAIRDITEQMAELNGWATRLPERWAAAGATTEGLDVAIASLANQAPQDLRSPEGILELLTAITLETSQARAVGETAAAIGAYGSITAFTPDDSGRPSATKAEPAPDSVRARIRQAYVELAREPGQSWISLVRLREHLADVPRAELDIALRELSHENGVHLQPEANQQVLTAADREAAVSFGGSSRHVLKVELSRRQLAATRRAREGGNR